MATNNITATTNGNKNTALGAGVALGNTGNKTPTTTQAELYGTDVSLGTKNQYDRKSPAYIDRTASNPSGYTKAGVTDYGDGRISRTNTWKWDLSTLKQDITFANGSKPIIQNSSQNKVRVTEIFDKSGSTVSYTWTVPSNIDLAESVYVQCVGAGGNGLSADEEGSYGGGGGAYSAREIKTIIGIGNTYTIRVGETGGTSASSLKDSSSTNIVIAKGAINTNGGITTGAVGDTVYAGGNGGAITAGLSPTGAGGGGGASASEYGGGANGVAGGPGVTGIAGGIAVGIGGSGGQGVDNVNTSLSTINGTTPGGGGGGGGLDDDALLAPGVGAPGRVIISYTIFV